MRPGSNRAEREGDQAPKHSPEPWAHLTGKNIKGKAMPWLPGAPSDGATPRRETMKTPDHRHSMRRTFE